MAKKLPRQRAEMNGRWYTKRGVELTRNDGWETESEHMSRIRSALRSASRFWKPALKALEKASRPYKGLNKRIKKEYQCANCLVWLIRAKVEINHKLPCGSINCYADVPQFLTNLFAECSTSYEIVCKECHKLITAEQKKERIRNGH